MFSQRKILHKVATAWFVLASLLWTGHALASNSTEIDALLKKADSVKSSNYTEFAEIVAQLRAKEKELSSAERNYLRYLVGWQGAYSGDYKATVVTLKDVLAESDDVTLRFRASATLVNILALSTQYEEAFSQLTQLLSALPSVSDKGAREQGLAVAAYLYNYLGEYDLGLTYAKMLKEENWNGRGACTGGQLELQALSKTAKMQSLSTRYQQTIDECTSVGEPMRANAVRLYLARARIDEGRFDDTIRLLRDHYAEVERLGSPRLLSEFDSLLASAYRQSGDKTLARQYALKTIESSVRNEYTEPLVVAYRILYVLSKEQGDTKAALAFHEKFSAADKGYLDDISAQQLAFQRARHEALANKSQIDTLNKQNEVLKLKQELADKAVETGRLYILILTMVLIFIALFAYKTKRSQVHFRKLSRLDGLTEIFNRPHFLEQAKQALKTASEVHQDACVILCDLDHFKSINDKFGHATGDMVLRKTVEVFQKHLRANDIVGRLGGEEFGFVLPGCDLMIARERCELIRGAIAEVEICEGELTAHVSASFGIAVTSSSGYELRQLLLHADKALYHAKRSGRNLVALYDADITRGKGTEDGSTAEQTIRGAA